MHRRPLPYLLLAASFAVAVPAAAEPPKPATGAAGIKQKDHADDLFDQAGDARDAGRFADAERLLLEAWSLKQTHDVAANLGLVQLKLGKLPEAAQHLAWALQHFPPSESAKARKALGQELATVRAKIGALRIQPSVEGADVTVNGQLVDATALADEVFVQPGTVTVTASRPGYLTASQTLTVTADAETQRVSLVLVPRGDQSNKRSVVPGAVLGGVAGAALVTGIGLTVGGAIKHASSTSLGQAITQAHHSCVTNALNFDPQCDALASTTSTADTLNHVGIGVLVGAGAAAVGSVAYFLWPESKPSARPAGGIHVAPTVSTSGGGILFSGAF
jgi:hypothetical protein